LRDDPGSARVRISADPFRGKVPRDDVASVLAAIVHEPRSVEHILYVASGDHLIAEALGAALAA
jgi:hypothetical protein